MLRFNKLTVWYKIYTLGAGVNEIKGGGPPWEGELDCLAFGWQLCHSFSTSGSHQ